MEDLTDALAATGATIALTERSAILTQAAAHIHEHFLSPS